MVLAAAPWWSFIGGVFGVLTVTANLVLPRRIGFGSVAAFTTFGTCAGSERQPLPPTPSNMGTTGGMGMGNGKWEMGGRKQEEGSMGLNTRLSRHPRRLPYTRNPQHPVWTLHPSPATRHPQRMPFMPSKATHPIHPPTPNSPHAPTPHPLPYICQPTTLTPSTHTPHRDPRMLACASRL